MVVSGDNCRLQKTKMRRNSISSKTGDKAKKSIAEAQALINANEFFSKSEDSFDLPIKLNLDGNCLAFENNTWVLGIF